MAQASAWKSAGTLLCAVLAACEREERPAPHVSVADSAPADSAPADSAPVGLGSNATPSDLGSPPKLELSPPTPEPQTLAPPAAAHVVGERAESRDYFMTLVAVTPCEVEPHFRPAPGHIKLGLEVLLEARGQSEVPTNPFLATLRDSEAREYRADIAGCTPTLRADRLAHSDQARGFITFEVPSDATGLVMTYAPFVVGVGPEVLTFALGR